MGLHSVQFLSPPQRLLGEDGDNKKKGWSKTIPRPAKFGNLEFNYFQIGQTLYREEIFVNLDTYPN